MIGKPRIMPWEQDGMDKLQAKDAIKAKESLLEYNASLHIDTPESPAVLTSIVCTINYERCESDIIAQLLKNGMKVARFDMSCLKASDQSVVVRKFRTCIFEYSKTTKRPCNVALAVELKGSTILTGSFLEGVEKINILTGDIIILTTNRAWDDKGSTERIFVDYDELSILVQPKDRLLLDNGRIELRVRGTVDSDIVCEILQGGDLSPHTVVIVLGVPINLGPITGKDVEDISFAVDNKIDAIFVPLVRKGRMLEDVKEVVAKKCGQILLFSKIDCRQAVDNFDDILKASDGVIINRGRLSIELPKEKVMLVQKNMVARAQKAGKPAYTMYEYLNAMIHNKSILHPESTDVLNTVIEGVDGIILVDETAIGDYPALAVETLATLCREGEAQVWQPDLFNTLNYYAAPPVDPAHAVCISAIEASFQLKAAAILIITISGKSAKLLARYKPPCPIFAMTRGGTIARRLLFYKGLIPVRIIEPPDPCWHKEVDMRMQDGIEFGKRMNIIKPGDALVLVNAWRPCAGFPNQIRIVYASTEKSWTLPLPRIHGGEEFMMSSKIT